MVRKMRLLVAAALILGISVPADAEENFELLKAKQIRARIVGKDISDGVHWSEYYRSDGALISVDMGTQRTGIQLSVYTMKADGFAGANDDVQKLAKGLRAALDKVDIKKS